MGPLQKLRFRRAARHGNEELLVQLATEAGMSESEVEKTIREGGIGGLIEALLKILTDPNLVAIINAIKNLFGLL